MAGVQYCMLYIRITAAPGQTREQDQHWRISRQVLQGIPNNNQQEGAEQQQSKQDTGPPSLCCAVLGLQALWCRAFEQLLPANLTASNDKARMQLKAYDE
jgi:hypothetical protein